MYVFKDSNSISFFQRILRIDGPFVYDESRWWVAFKGDTGPGSDLLSRELDFATLEAAEAFAKTLTDIVLTYGASPARAIHISADLAETWAKEPLRRLLAPNLAQFLGKQRAGGVTQLTLDHVSGDGPHHWKITAPNGDGLEFTACQNTLHALPPRPESAPSLVPVESTALKLSDIATP